MTLPQTIELEPGAPARATVFILHGLGADGTDFLPFADELKLADVGPVRFVFPRAPVRPVTANGGAAMRAWYDIFTFGSSGGPMREDEDGLRESFAAVHGLLEREMARGIAARRIVLAGFSQGGAITLQTGLRQAEPLAGLIALSSYLPLAPLFEAERSAGSAKVTVFLAHGSADPVVPLARGVASRDQLKSLGYAVEWHDYPMPHSVCTEEIEHIAGFMKRVLA